MHALHELLHFRVLFLVCRLLEVDNSGVSFRRGRSVARRVVRGRMVPPLK